MTDNVVFLAERLATKQRLQGGSDPADDGLAFLYDEGLDLLASYRSIPDRTTRLRFKALIDAAASSEEHAGQGAPKPFATLQEGAAGPATFGSRGKKVAGFIALLIGASFFLEIADPASTDVAASVLCQAVFSPGP